MACDYTTIIPGYLKIERAPHETLRSRSSHLRGAPGREPSRGPVQWGHRSSEHTRRWRTDLRASMQADETMRLKRPNDNRERWWAMGSGWICSNHSIINTQFIYSTQVTAFQKYVEISENKTARYCKIKFFKTHNLAFVSPPEYHKLHN